MQRAPRIKINKNKNNKNKKKSVEFDDETVLYGLVSDVVKYNDGKETEGRIGECSKCCLA